MSGRTPVPRSALHRHQQCAPTDHAQLPQLGYPSNQTRVQGLPQTPLPEQPAAHRQTSDAHNIATAAHAQHDPALRPARPHAQKIRRCAPTPALPQPSPCSVTRAAQTAPAPAAVPAPAPAPHKLHPPAPHETPAPAAPAPPPHPACTNANARVRSASRQSGAQIALSRCALLAPCLCSLWRAALRSSRSPPPGSGSLHQRSKKAQALR